MLATLLVSLERLILVSDKTATQSARFCPRLIIQGWVGHCIPHERLYESYGTVPLLTNTVSNQAIIIFLIIILRQISQKLTHYRPAMPFGNRKKYFTGWFQFIIVRIEKK